MNTEPLPAATSLSESDIIARLDAARLDVDLNPEQSHKNGFNGGAFAPAIGVVAMMAVALPLVFALHTNPQSDGLLPPGNAPAQPTFIGWNFNFESAQQIATQKQQMMMIAFYTDSCPACKWMDREVYGRAPIIAEAQNIVPVKINAEGQPQIASRYNVHKYPTIVWTDAAGNEKCRSDGSINGYELYQAMQRNHST